MDEKLDVMLLTKLDQSMAMYLVHRPLRVAIDKIKEWCWLSAASKVISLCDTGVKHIMYPTHEVRQGQTVGLVSDMVYYCQWTNPAGYELRSARGCSMQVGGCKQDLITNSSSRSVVCVILFPLSALSCKHASFCTSNAQYTQQMQGPYLLMA